MNAKEQLFVAEQKMAYVKTCLREDLEEWERKEYTALMLDYEVEIAALIIHIETNKELFNELPDKEAMYPDGEIKIHDGE